MFRIHSFRFFKRLPHVTTGLLLLLLSASCHSIREKEMIRYQNKKTSEQCLLVLPLPVKGKEGNRYELDLPDYSLFHFFHYRRLSPGTSPQDFIENCRKAVTEALTAEGFQLQSSEKAVFQEWSGLFLKFLQKSDEINWNVWILQKNGKIISFGFGYFSSSPIPHLDRVVSEMLDSFAVEETNAAR